ncbi:MAG: hypothetical protein DRP01_00495 [Archaeoglobales archaeon]|nr:MAG: hypothetical protein DRP01_00495 [Archaeoglobales archaeon]
MRTFRYEDIEVNVSRDELYFVNLKTKMKTKPLKIPDPVTFDFCIKISRALAKKGWVKSPEELAGQIFKTVEEIRAEKEEGIKIYETLDERGKKIFERTASIMGISKKEFAEKILKRARELGVSPELILYKYSREYELVQRVKRVVLLLEDGSLKKFIASPRVSIMIDTCYRVKTESEEYVGRVIGQTGVVRFDYLSDYIPVDEGSNELRFLHSDPRIEEIEVIDDIETIPDASTWISTHVTFENLSSIVDLVSEKNAAVEGVCAGIIERFSVPEKLGGARAVINVGDMSLRGRCSAWIDPALYPEADESWVGKLIYLYGHFTYREYTLFDRTAPGLNVIPYFILVKQI